MTDESGYSKVVAEVRSEHLLMTHSSHRNGIVTKRAGCSCDTIPLFDWDQRDEQYRAHVDLRIFVAGLCFSPEWGVSQ